MFLNFIIKLLEDTVHNHENHQKYALKTRQEGKELLSLTLYLTDHDPNLHVLPSKV